MNEIPYEAGFYPKQYYPEPLRMVRYWDQEQKREFVFVTNATPISALQVAELYKNRWQVELFFKWLKQHLKIKKFWGTTENAVRIQIYAAMIVLTIMAKVKESNSGSRSYLDNLGPKEAYKSIQCRFCSRFPGHGGYCDFGQCYVSDYRADGACIYFRG